jgi:hypothetical protein
MWKLVLQKVTVAQKRAIEQQRNKFWILARE